MKKGYVITWTIKDNTDAQLLVKCEMKALAVSKELGITGFKAILRFCQEAVGERVPTASSGDLRGVAMANHA